MTSIGERPTPEQMREVGRQWREMARSYAATIRQHELGGCRAEEAMAEAHRLGMEFVDAVDARDFDRAVTVMLDHNLALARAIILGAEATSRIIAARAAGERPRLSPAQFGQMERLMALVPMLDQAIANAAFVLAPDDDAPVDHPICND